MQKLLCHMITSNINQISLLLMFVSSLHNVFDSLRIFCCVFKPCCLTVAHFINPFDMEHYAKLIKRVLENKSSWIYYSQKSSYRNNLSKLLQAPACVPIFWKSNSCHILATLPWIPLIHKSLFKTGKCFTSLHKL